MNNQNPGGYPYYDSQNYYQNANYYQQAYSQQPEASSSSNPANYPHAYSHTLSQGQTVPTNSTEVNTGVVGYNQSWNVPAYYYPPPNQPYYNHPNAYGHYSYPQYPVSAPPPPPTEPPPTEEATSEPEPPGTEPVVTREAAVENQKIPQIAHPPCTPPLVSEQPQTPPLPEGPEPSEMDIVPPSPPRDVDTPPLSPLPKGETPPPVGAQNVPQEEVIPVNMRYISTGLCLYFLCSFI